MKHPSQEILALHAGGDLGWLAGWKTARHVAACERCAAEVAAFSELREALPELERDSRGALEPHGGGHAGQYSPRAGRRRVCASSDASPCREPVPLFRGARATLALASVLALMVTGLMLEGPAPRRSGADPIEPVVQATAHGIQRRSGDQGFAPDARRRAAASPTR